MRHAVAALLVMSGCSLVATSATPHRASPTGPPTGCDSIVWPIGDLLLAPLAVGTGAVVFVGSHVESDPGPQYVIGPILLVVAGFTALTSGVVGFSRIGHCEDALPRPTPDPRTPAPPKPVAPDPNDDSRPSWGE